MAPKASAEWAWFLGEQSVAQHAAKDAVTGVVPVFRVRVAHVHRVGCGPWGATCEVPPSTPSSSVIRLTDASRSAAPAGCLGAGFEDAAYGGRQCAARLLGCFLLEVPRSCRSLRAYVDRPASSVRLVRCDPHPSCSRCVAYVPRGWLLLLVYSGCPVHGAYQTCSPEEGVGGEGSWMVDCPRAVRQLLEVDVRWIATASHLVASVET